MEKEKSMGEKDITEKVLEDYNDVFADIVNGLLFKGEQRIRKEDLRTINPVSQYKADDSRLHEQVRDVVKEWTVSNVRIAICGLENQSAPDKNMPLRVFGYEGASYRGQAGTAGPKVPVVTLVLYFGTERHWPEARNLKSIVPVPAELDPYVNDFKINVFEIAWLTDEEISRFRSDFREVANFFVQCRLHKEYHPYGRTEISHIDEMLKLLSVMTGNDQFEMLLQSPGKEEIHNMYDVAERLVSKGRTEGRAEGRAEGRLEERINSVSMILRNGSEADAARFLGATAEEIAKAKKLNAGPVHSAQDQ